MLLLFVGVLAGLDVLGYGGCVFRDMTSLPCPGCGLTTAARHALRGEWEAAAASNIFLPAFLGLFVLVAVSAVLPVDVRRRWVAGVARWEQRSGAGVFFAVAIVAYWFIRLC